MKKILLSLIIGLLVIVAVIAVAVGLYIGPIMKAGIETFGPKITQVPIKLDAVDVSLLGGGAAIKGLVVGNPEGFSSPQAIKLGKAEVKLDVMSVTSSKIKVRKVHVVSPEITFDGSLRGNNLTKILDNVNKSAPKEKASGAKTDASAQRDKGESKPAPKIQVDDFLITGAKVHVHLTGLTSKELNVVLPDIHLTGIGKNEEGITPVELVRVVLSQVTTATLKEVTRAVTASGQIIEGIGKDVAGEAGGTIKSVTKSLKGLFDK